jgi:hypothetical protein
MHKKIYPKNVSKRSGKALADPRRLLALLAILLACNVVEGNATWAQQAPSGSEFYFHYKSQLYRNENSSIVELEEANLTMPVGGASKIVDVAAAIRNATTLLGTIWVGSVAWFTPPFAAPTTIDGQLIFTLWLSGNGSAPLISGVGAGAAVIDEKGQLVGNYAYSYSYAKGSILTPTPKEYAFKVNFNHGITSGEKLAFAVGVGSTAVYWPMHVYFDSVDYPSRVQLPANVTVIPEFAVSSSVLNLFVTFALSLILLRRRHGVR